MRRPRLIVGAAVVVVLAVGVTIWLIARPAAGRPDAFTPAVRAELTGTARDDLEHGALPYEMPDKGSLACAVRVLGTDPPAVTAAKSATAIYAWAMCATVGTAVQSSFSLPVAIRLTSPPTAQEPVDGEGNTADKHRLFPRRLWTSVDGDSSGQDGLEAQMQQRVRQKA